MQNSNPKNHPERRRSLYGRRQARPLKERQKNLFENLLKDITFSLSKTENTQLFQKECVWIEIGFGGGEHLYQQALKHPDVIFIGCEPFINGVGSLLTQIDDHKLGNIFIFQDDARLLLSHIPSHSLEKVFLLFPDPWPKNRHHKRRFVQQETIKEIHRLLKPGCEWRIATDHPSYYEWVLEQFKTQESVSLFKQKREDVYNRPDVQNWPETRYEQKAKLAGRRGAFFSFVAL
jgi:tRNA (guanine-N7-)-methyltransferase